jgi:hypothetical protein
MIELQSCALRYKCEKLKECMFVVHVLFVLHVAVVCDCYVVVVP